MIHKEWVTNVQINPDDTIDVDFLDGLHQKYSDPADIKEVFRLVADQQVRALNGEDMVEGTF